MLRKEERQGEQESFRQVAPVLAGMREPDGLVPLRDPGMTDTEELLLAAGVPSAEIESMRGQGIVA